MNLHYNEDGVQKNIKNNSQKKIEMKLTSQFFESLKKKSQNLQKPPRFSNSSQANKNQNEKSIEPILSKNFLKKFQNLRPTYKVAEDLKYKPRLDAESIDLVSLLTRPPTRSKPTPCFALRESREGTPEFTKGQDFINFQESQVVETSETVIEINAKIANL